MDLGLDGLRAIVTGGNRGIGLAVADRLAQEGAHTALVARDEVALAAAADRVGRHGTRVTTHPTDVTDDAAVRATVAAVVAAHGGVDVLVNAAARRAGAGPVPPLTELTDDAVRVELETKVLGYLRFARATAPHMTAQGFGRIVNVSGLNARLASSLVGSVRNVAVVAMTKNLADELGPSGVLVTVVHPGHTVTERTPDLLAAAAERAGSTPEEVAGRLAAGTSTGRLATADEVADVVTFLASPRNAAITGDVVAAGGGSRGAIHY